MDSNKITKSDLDILYKDVKDIVLDYLCQLIHFEKFAHTRRIIEHMDVVYRPPNFLGITRIKYDFDFFHTIQYHPMYCYICTRCGNYDRSMYILCPSAKTKCRCYT